MSSDSDSDFTSDSELEAFAEALASSIISKSQQSSSKDESESDREESQNLKNNKMVNGKDRKRKKYSPVSDDLRFIIDKGPSTSQISDADSANETAVFDLSYMNFPNSQTDTKLEPSLQTHKNDDSSDEDLESDDSGNVDEDEQNNDITHSNQNGKQKAVDSDKKKGKLSSRLQSSLKSTVYFRVQPDFKSKSVNKKEDEVQAKKQSKEPEIMKKCVLPDDIERMTTIATTQESVRKLKKQRKLEREKTKGSKWFDMPAPEMTEKYKNDLEILKMRNALNPKRFYKSDDRAGLPKYFQFGRIVETPADFYHSRVPKKQRKATLVEELLADAEFRKFNKRKYAEVQETKRQRMGPYNRMKRIKKKKKF